MNSRIVERPLYGIEAGAPARCDVPFDAKYFDDSSIQDMPKTGQEVLLARFELQPQYCGLFLNFSQFVGNQNRWLRTVIETKGLQWLILMNNRPLYPFIALQHIINPWGYGSFPVAIRLDENATVEFVARNVSYAGPTNIEKVGGRITGRYWYNQAYGDVAVRDDVFR